jgi:hypothetical protein
VSGSRVLERGDVLFFSRPRVDRERVRDLEDVQRFFLVLAPDGTRRYRRLVIGRKRLPDIEGHERGWALVTDAGEQPEEVGADLGRQEYETRTRGRRVLPEARPAGEGRYAIAWHDDHAHLAYELVDPPEPGEAQRAFGIRRQASYIVAIRNPDPAPGERRFFPLDDPTILDRERVELVMIGAAEDAEDELGIELDARAERREAEDLLATLGIAPSASRDFAR